LGIGANTAISPDQCGVLHPRRFESPRAFSNFILWTMPTAAPIWTARRFPIRISSISANRTKFLGSPVHAAGLTLTDSASRRRNGVSGSANYFEFWA